MFENFFGAKRQPQSYPPRPSMEEISERLFREKTSMGSDEVVIELAKEKEKEVLPLFDPLFEDYTQAWNLRKEGFQITFIRFGDFLSIHISAVRVWKTGKGLHAEPYKHAATIPLAQVKRITFTKGSAPNHKGRVDYRAKLLESLSADSDEPKRYEVKAMMPVFRDWQPLLIDFKSRAQDESYSYPTWDSRSFPIAYSTFDAPKAAVDDTIEFSGIDQILYVPAGLDEDVYYNMLVALETGFSGTVKPDIAIKSE